MIGGFSTTFLLLLIKIWVTIADDSVVFTDGGYVQGIVTPTHRRFLGIPYAKPPIGNLRWASPEPASPWSPNTLNATAWGPGCPQICILPPHTCPPVTSEDCLTVNVYTPMPVQNNLTVMLWIHGGRFEQGAGGTGLYDGYKLVPYTNVILVTFNYRLGALGWLTDGASVPGNFALQDQRLVLQWVQNNIAYFGGDPNKVTLFGQSAGASSTAVHMTSPSSWGYFNRAIIQSNPYTLPIQSASRAATIGANFCEIAGCPNCDLTCLRSINVTNILTSQKAAQQKIPYLHILDLFLPWTPVVDGNDVPMTPIEAFSTGKTAPGVPTIMGTVSEDSYLFIYQADSNPISPIEYVGAVTYIFEYDAFDVLGQYPAPSIFTSNDTRPELARLGTDYIFQCSTRVCTSANESKNRPAGPMYLYRFDHVLSFDPWGPEYYYCIGHVCHGSELPLEFNTTDPYFILTEGEIELSEQIMKYFANFAETGTPNSPRPVDVSWPEYNFQSDEWMILDTPSHVATGPHSQICDFWDGVGYNWGL